MKKNVFAYALFALLLICVMVSCNNGSSPTPAEPDRPSKLEVSSFKNNYPVGATKDDLVGNLIYTDTKGKITTVDIKAEGVTTNFDAKTAAKNKILTITYKGIDASATYDVIDVPERINLEGCYVVDDLTTFEFVKGSKDVTIGKYTDWNGYMNFAGDQPTESSATYTIGVSPSGFTTIKVKDATYYKEGKTLYPDGNGGLRRMESDYLPEPKIGEFYVSTRKEVDNDTTAEQARGKFFVAKFTTDGKMVFCFLNNLDNIATDFAAATKYTVDKIKFNTYGIYFDKVTVDVNKNLRMYSNDKFKTIVIVSDADDTYKGFNYTLVLSEE